MDPLSITVSIVALIGAANTTIKIVRGIYKAPEELDSLSNDLLGTELTVHDFQTLLRDDNPSLQDEQKVALCEKLSEAEAVMSQLKTALDGLLKAGCGRNRSYKWIKAKSKTQKLGRDLAIIHKDLLTRMDQLGKQRLELEIQSLSKTQSQIQSTLSLSFPIRKLQEETQASLGELHQKTSFLIKTVEGNYQTQDGDSHRGSLSSGCSAKSLGILTGSHPTTNSSYQSLVLNVRHYSPTFCAESCGCICHSRQSCTTPSLLATILGRFLVGYHGIPLLMRSCNDKRCKRQSKPAIFATYHFPQWWALNRVLVFVAKYTITGAPKLALSFMRRVPSMSRVFTAAQCGDVESLKQLFKNGEASPADVRDWKPCGTLLEVALLKENWSMFEFLTNAGADLEVQDYRGRTALEQICLRFFTGMLTQPINEWIAMRFLPRLLEYTQFPSLHETVLGLRVSNIQQEAAKFLTTSATINDCDFFGYTALAWASRRGDLASIKHLIELGADPNIKNPQKVYPLHMSMYSGSIDCVLYLLRNSADAKSLDMAGDTTINIAVRKFTGHGLLDLLDELFLHGADIETSKPLRIAIQERNYDAIRWLLQHGASYHYPDPHTTYLHILGWWADLPTIEVIREASWTGINVHALTGVDCVTAMEYITHKDRPVCASPKLMQSFSQLLSDIEIRTNEQISVIVEDDIFEDCVEFQETPAS